MSDLTKYHPVAGIISKLLTDAGCDFKTFEHEAVRTSEEAAAVRPEYSIAQGGKALIVRIKRAGVTKEEEKQFAQIVVPGDAKFDPKKARNALGAKDIRFATPEEVDRVTGGVLPGGVPPFGNLFHIPVYVDMRVLQNDEMIFNAGDRRFSIAMKTDDYTRVASPTVVDIVET